MAYLSRQPFHTLAILLSALQRHGRGSGEKPMAELGGVSDDRTAPACSQAVPGALLKSLMMLAPTK